jgi:hypothetical protein
MWLDSEGVKPGGANIHQVTDEPQYIDYPH